MIPHLLAFALAQESLAATDTPPETGASGRTTSWPAMSGGPVVGVTQVGGGASLLTGGRFGVTLDRLVFLGVMSEGTPLVDGFRASLRDGRRLGQWQLGAVADISPFDRAVVHPRFGVALAGAWMGTDGPLGSDSSFAVVVEPTMTLELSVHRMVRVGATAGYRFAMPTTNLVKFSEASGVVSGLTVQIGIFE